MPSSVAAPSTSAAFHVGLFGDQLSGSHILGGFSSAWHLFGQILPAQKPRCYWSCQGQSLDPGNPNMLVQRPLLNRPKVKQIGDNKKKWLH